MRKIFGSLQPEIIGTVMKDCVRRATLEIARQRMTFISTPKKDAYNKEDLVTSADFAAQEIYISALTEAFPYAGIVAEEEYSRECTDSEYHYYFTIDPLDGTRAYERRQSHGVTSMLAFVFEGEVCGITIGDPNTRELFHSRPGSSNVYRIYEFENAERLQIDTERSLGKQYLQLREDPRSLSVFSQALYSPGVPHSLFHNIEVMGGSIGSMFTRLWKGEVGGILIGKSQQYQTPWDATPVYGMSKKLGFNSYQIINGVPSEFTFCPERKIIETPHEVLFIHESRAQELFEWCKK